MLKNFLKFFWKHNGQAASLEFLFVVVILQLFILVLLPKLLETNLFVFVFALLFSGLHCLLIGVNLAVTGISLYGTLFDSKGRIYRKKD